MRLNRRVLLGSVAAGAAVAAVGNAEAQAAALVRRDVMDMPTSDGFFTDYAKAVKAMHALDQKDGRNRVRQAQIHADYCHHGEAEFLHWHRHYIRFFERICAQLSGNPDFALPYWNWSKNSGRMPTPFYDMPELNVENLNDPGRYNGKSWGPVNTVPKRGLKKTQGLSDDATKAGPFTASHIEDIKRLPAFDEFRSALEGGPHNTGHVISGAISRGVVGHIGDGLSPLDPIFWLHHCMVDRVWAEWQRGGHVTPDPSTSYQAQFFLPDGSAAEADSKGAMTIAGLGYTYDVIGNSASTSPATQLSPATINEIIRLTSPGPAVTLGQAKFDSVSKPLIQTFVDVPVPSLAKVLDQGKELSTLGLTVRSRRVIAVLSGIQPPDGNDLIVNAFVNCPYLSPETPAADPHYAGSFSFFGSPKNMGMDVSVVVDLTGPLSQYSEAPNQIRFQLMPIMASAGGDPTWQLQVGSVSVVAL